jgi:hypothetical protein
LEPKAGQAQGSVSGLCRLSGRLHLDWTQVLQEFMAERLPWRKRDIGVLEAEGSG